MHRREIGGCCVCCPLSAAPKGAARPAIPIPRRSPLIKRHTCLIDVVRDKHASYFGLQLYAQPGGPESGSRAAVGGGCNRDELRRGCSAAVGLQASQQPTAVRVGPGAQTAACEALPDSLGSDFACFSLAGNTSARRNPAAPRWTSQMWRRSPRLSPPAPALTTTRCPRAAARSAAALPHLTSVHSGPAGLFGCSVQFRRRTRLARRPISWSRHLRRRCCRLLPSWRPQLRLLRARPRSACSAAPVSGLGRGSQGWCAEEQVVGSRLEALHAASGCPLMRMLPLRQTSPCVLQTDGNGCKLSKQARTVWHAPCRISTCPCRRSCPPTAPPFLSCLLAVTTPMWRTVNGLTYCNADGEQPSLLV